MALDPSTLLQEAIRAVPAVKYALGIAGILAVLAIAKAFELDARFAVGGTIVVLALMVVLLIFAKLSTSASRHFVAPALFLTWGSLGLMLAAAAMLFSSAFFGRPIDLRPAGSGRSVMPEERPPDAESAGTNPIAELVDVQLGASDYAGAWTTVRNALEHQPDARELLALEARVAAAWLRDMHHGEGQTFTALVDPLLGALYRASLDKEKQLAADALAHIGYAGFLKSRDGAPRFDVDTSYRKALDLDPANPYANVMLGFWLLRHDKPPSAAQPYFEAALASGRDRDFARHLQIAALQWNKDIPGALALLRVCNDMRQHGELLDVDMRRRIVSGTYGFPSRELMDALETALPPKEHLATLRWLVEDMDVSQSAYQRFFLARLSEAAGDCAKALPIYTELSLLDTTLDAEIEAGAARCTKLLNSGAP